MAWKAYVSYGPFQSEQEWVVKVARIIEPTLIEDEGVGEGTDFQKPVPVRRMLRARNVLERAMGQADPRRESR